jgi:hypothetical protein
MEDSNPNTIYNQLQLEHSIRLLDNRPENILEFARRLNLNDFKDIKVRGKVDDKKHTHVHHLARAKSKV